MYQCMCTVVFLEKIVNYNNKIENCFTNRNACLEKIYF